LTECPWGDKQEQKIGIPPLTKLELHNFCMCTGHQDRWFNSFNWSMLTHAVFTCASFITILGDQLTGLRSLKLHLPFFSCGGILCSQQVNREHIKNFLLTCSRLSELGLLNITQVVDEELFHHLGSSIKSLKLHDHEDFDKRHVLDVNQLQQLGRYCPLIRKLSIDISYENGWVSTETPFLFACIRLISVNSLTAHLTSLQKTSGLWNNWSLI
jgi:hypothetical protein